MSVKSTRRIRRFTSPIAGPSRLDIARKNPYSRRGAVCYNLRNELQSTVSWLVQKRLFSETFGKLFSRWGKLQVWCALGQTSPPAVTFESMTLEINGASNANLLLSVYKTNDSPVYTSVIQDEHGHFPYWGLDALKTTIINKVVHHNNGSDHPCESRVQIVLKQNNNFYRATISAEHTAYETTVVLLAAFCVVAVILGRPNEPSRFLGPPITTVVTHSPPRRDIFVLRRHIQNRGGFTPSITTLWHRWMMAEVAAEWLLHRWPVQNHTNVRAAMQQQQFVYANYFPQTPAAVAAWNAAQTYELIVNLVKRTCTDRHAVVARAASWTLSPSLASRQQQAVYHNLKLVSTALGVGRALVGHKSLRVFAVCDSYPG